MPGNSSLLGRLYVLLLYILLQAAAITMLVRNSYFQQSFIMRGIHGIQYGLWEKSANIKNYFQLRSLNRTLAEENAQLRNRLSQLTDLESLYRSAMASDSLTVRDRAAFFYIPAEVVHSTTQRQNNFLIINKGKAQGVRPDMGVICNKGVVGIVNHVTQNYASVISLLNISQRISARLLPEGSTGTLLWPGKSSRTMLLTDFLQHQNVHLGDTVVTSGLSAVFPPDIPIGSVSGQAVKKGIYLDLDVSLFMRFENLRYVTVAGQRYQDEIQSNIEQEDAY